jgi:hypothetical protein
MTEPKFDPGRIVATPGALEAFSEEHLLICLRRHLQGDWGDLDSEDWEANNAALRGGSRLLSAYVHADGGKLWIITEWDRSVTTFLLPSEY